MQNTHTQKGKMSLLVSILIVLFFLGGSTYLYIKNPEIEKPSDITNVHTYTADDPIFATSPKGIFLERNDALYNAGSFDEMMAVSSRYDTEARRLENESLFKETNNGKKDAYFAFAQSLIKPSSVFTSISESLSGDVATVVAFDEKGQKTTAVFIKEGGEWKIDNINTVVE